MAFAPFLAAAYAATLLRLFTRRPRLAGAFAPAGRMALTNYLAQSLMCVLVFTGLGWGLVGRTSPAQTLLIALGAARLDPPGAPPQLGC